MSGSRICVGAIGGAYGVRGEVRVKSFCAVAEEGYKRFPCDLPQLLDQVMGAFGISLPENQLTTLKLVLFRKVEIYLRSRFKAEFVSALAPLKPVVYGSEVWRKLVPESVELFVYDGPEPLIVDLDDDGYCDDINPSLEPTREVQKLER